MIELPNEPNKTMRATLDCVNLTSLVVLTGGSGKSKHLLHDESINGLLESVAAMEVDGKSMLLKVVLENELNKY